MIIKFILTFIVAFGLCATIMPIVIIATKKLKFRQTILKYVDKHQGKSGTPTMGGIGFIISIVVTGLIFLQKSEQKFMIMLLLITFGYGVVGFLDDFIKIFFKRNEGLSPWQKIIFQFLLAIIVSVYAYNSLPMGDKLYLPFTLKALDIGVWIIPLYVLIFLALTNSVNLTDGLDGLAASVSRIYVLIFATIIAITTYVDKGSFFDGQAVNLIIYCIAVAGALTGFLLYNFYPAKIFMGDTGSLALGGGLGALAVFSSQTLIVPIIGVMYVLSAVSVILQVAYYKKTKKRIFLMAPLHHHFEKKGVHENRIVGYYTAITLLVGLLVIAVTLLVNI